MEPIMKEAIIHLLETRLNEAKKELKELNTTIDNKIPPSIPAIEAKAKIQVYSSLLQDVQKTHYVNDTWDEYCIKNGLNRKGERFN
jgi:hypothetical protein